MWKKGKVKAMPSDKPVDLETLTEAVYAMRDAQKMFFASKRPAYLLRAKELERVVDEMVREILKGKANP